jgi:L-iditol 2-dehydrogenase
VNDLFFRNDVTLTTSYAGSPTDYAEALGLIGEGKARAGEMITHRLGLGEIGRGFHLLTHPEEEQAIKIVLQPQR